MTRVLSSACGNIIHCNFLFFFFFSKNRFAKQVVLSRNADSRNFYVILYGLFEICLSMKTRIFANYEEKIRVTWKVTLKCMALSAH